MATLTIHQKQMVTHLNFDAPKPLSELLAQAGIPLGQPCGGRGICGKCAVMLMGSVSSPNSAEQKLGIRLACQAVITGDADVTLSPKISMKQIEGGSTEALLPASPMNGKYGAAIDIGTTTVALLLYNLQNGHCLGSASMLNPQTSVAGDVIGRIDAALHGYADDLRQQIESGIRSMLITTCAQAHISHGDVEALVITGNTTMLYLLTGQNPMSLSHAPFHADCLFGHEANLLDRFTYLPVCLHAFVGADTTCAILASGMMQKSKTALLCDVGTNGELALWHCGKLYIASTAAGPAFEGAGIKHGCSSVSGAIDQVKVVNGIISCRTIDDAKAVGICGSGLIDAIAAMLDLDILDETGYLDDEEYHLRDNIALVQADIRAVQLAKAATYAGIMSLLSAANCSADEVNTLYLAGGFGSHLNIPSAVRIGLIPSALAGKVQVIGNAALNGAARLLMDTTLRQSISSMRDLAYHVRLDGNSEFSERYIDAMLFPAK